MRQSARVLRFPVRRSRHAPSSAVFAPIVQLEAEAHTAAWFASACVGALAIMAAITLAL